VAWFRRGSELYGRYIGHGEHGVSAVIPESA
jgi:hypothetical protein